MAPFERRLGSLENRPSRQDPEPEPDRQNHLLHDQEQFRAGLERSESEQRRLALRLEAFETAWRQHMPALLDVTTRARDFTDKVQSAIQRIETLEGRQRRQQAQLDMVTAALVRPPAVQPGPEPFAATRPAGGPASRSSEGSTRLSFCGPGVRPREGYMNVSRTCHEGFDFVSAGLDLPFAPGSITDLVAHGFLEGLAERTLRDEVLPAWRELLQPGARMRLVALDLEAAMEAVGRGEATLTDLRESLFDLVPPRSAEERLGSPGTPVRNLLWPETLRRMTEETGFVEATRGAASHTANGLAEFTIEAIRP
ncbi:MAG: hypothetical protein ACRYG8_41470 [Janthinobacterium lividum]